jgi:hypothetical protein
VVETDSIQNVSSNIDGAEKRKPALFEEAGHSKRGEAIQ